MTKYLNFFESESGFTEAVEAGQLYYPNVSYTEEDDTVHWNLEQPADPVETPMLRMHFTTSSPGEEVKLHRYSDSNVTAMEIDGTPVNYTSGGTYSVAEPGNHTAVYQFTSSTVPERLFFVSGYPFSAFKSAEITTAVTAVGYSAFAGCEGLSGVTIPDSVTTIGFGAFAYTGLRSVTIPDSVTSMGHTCFNSCAQMRTATVGGGVTAIGEHAFGECTSLQSVALPDGLKAIGNEVFIDCYLLHDINIPSGVTTIGEHAFLNCSGLTAIYLNPETPPSLGANALDNANDCPIYVPAASVDTYKEAWPKYAYRIKTKHRISASVNDEDKGEVMLDQETAPEGDQVDFDVMVFDSEQNQITSVTVTDGNGDEVEYTGEDWGGGLHHYSFTMPASDVTISVVIEENSRGQYWIGTTLNDYENGQIDLYGRDYADEGDEVNFNVYLTDPGIYQVSSIVITDGNSDEVPYTDEGDNHYTFTMPASDVTISVTIEEKPKYHISVDLNDEELGKVNLEKETASEGDQVNFNVRIFDSGQNQVSSVTVTDGNGDEVEYTVKDYGGGVLHLYTFKMPASNVTISVTIEKKQ